MFVKLLAAFIVIPMVELYVLLTVGSYLGAVATIAIVILTGIVGASLMRSQGFRILFEINQAANQGRVPRNELIQGLLILFGGITLFTPGFITDFIGLCMLLPFTRKPIAIGIQHWIEHKIASGQWSVQFGNFNYRP